MTELNKSTNEELKNGVDSGKVEDGVKFQLFVNSLGICAAENCNQRLVHYKTKLGECAHIIPRKVGSHPREDYQMPLEDRRKDTNLLYLCEIHHKIIDDKKHADTFTANLLRKWKKNHEIWATGINKNLPNIPSNLQEILTNIGNQVAENVTNSEIIINTLLDACHDLLRKQLINEAYVLLSQIDILLLKQKNTKLDTKAAYLNAILLIHNEQIPDAKKLLLDIIQEEPLNVEAMLEYIELCDNTPEPYDELNRIETLLRDLKNDHPRLLLIDLSRKYKKQEPIEEPGNFDRQFDDVWMNARLFCQHSLFLDLDQKIDQRDNLLNKWQKTLPNSPRPHLYMVIYKTSDIFRSSIKQSKNFTDALTFSKNEREIVRTKDPLKLREQILWLMQEIELELGYIGITGDIKNLSEIITSMVSLIGQCYFDSFIDSILQEFLSNLQIEQEQWKLIICKIYESKVIPSQKTVESLFVQALQYNELYCDLESFVNSYDCTGLYHILQAIKDNDAPKVAKHINDKKDFLFTSILLQSIIRHEISIPLISLLEFTNEHQQDFIYARLKILEFKKQDKEALDLINSLDIDKAAPLALRTIEKFSHKNEQWHHFIPSTLRLLNFETPQSYKIHLHGKLAIAYFHQGDDTNVVTHAEYALSQSQELGEENSRHILSILGQALLMKGLPNQACLNFDKYSHIKRSFSLLLEEADLYLKSDFPDKHDKSLSLILKAFEEVDNYDDKLYLSAFTLLVELSNTNKIPMKNEPSIENGLFVKLDGFPNNWFYIGEEKTSLGATCIKPGTANYKAIIHKPISEEIEWPADRFSNRNSKHKVLHIATAPTFLCQRAHEAMAHTASLGDEAIWSIQMINEDGKLHQQNLKQFYDEQFRPGNEFFEAYSNSSFPFSFLCKMQGGLLSAVGRLCSERKGFIRCNNGTQAEIDAQQNTANDALKGQACFMDALSALMLVEAGLLETVINALPNLGVSTSVIRLLRKIAANLETSSSSMGRGGFVDGNFEFRPKDKEKEEAFRDKLLQAADLLDLLPNKVVGKTYQKLEGDKNLDYMLPNYFVDAFRYAQEKNTHLMTDDTLLVQAYSLVGESTIPRHFSSLSLIRALTENNQITWDDYLKYFALLSGYRYHLLPLSVTDMLQTILPTTAGGLITPAPQNISFLNLQLTLSSEYGVDDKTVIAILSSLLTKLILDDSVTSELAEEIFPPIISGGLAKRDKILTKVLFQICLQNMMPNKNWISMRSEKKLEVLKKQLIRFSWYERI